MVEVSLSRTEAWRTVMENKVMESSYAHTYCDGKRDGIAKHLDGVDVEQPLVDSEIATHRDDDSDEIVTYAYIVMKTP